MLLQSRFQRIPKRFHDHPHTLRRQREPIPSQAHLSTLRKNQFDRFKLTSYRISENDQPSS